MVVCETIPKTLNRFSDFWLLLSLDGWISDAVLGQERVASCQRVLASTGQHSPDAHSCRCHCPARSVGRLLLSRSPIHLHSTYFTFRGHQITSEIAIPSILFLNIGEAIDSS